MRKLFSEDETAKMLGLKRATLARRRVTGGGPGFVRVGGRIMYPEDEVREYLDSLPVLHSTADAPRKPSAA